MSFGMFEANITSDEENKRQVREAANKLAAATYDVRERFGPFLFAARDLAEYNDRLALSKTDILRTIEPHVFPRTGTVRRVLKPLEREFKALRQNSMMRQAAPEDDLYSVIAPGLSPSSSSTSSGLAENPFANGGFDPSKIPGVTGGPNTPGPKDPTGGLLTPPSSSAAAPSAPSTPSPASPSAPSAPSTPGTDTPAASANPVGGGAGGGGSDWSPNGNTDPIGEGKYTIQQGDTYGDLAQRAGWGDDYKGFAQSTGYQADNPDMIYAGDTIDVKAKPGSDSASSSSSTPASDSTSAGSAPLAAEVGGSASGGNQSLSSGASGGGYSLPAGESNTQTGLTNPTKTGSRRRADFERNLDTDVTFSPHEGELEPEGDFKGYLSDVGQGAEGKVDRNFGGTFPGGSDHDEDPAKTDFVKGATRRFAAWCQHNKVRVTLAALDDYAPSDREYIAIAADLQRLAGQHDIKTPWSDDFGQQVNPYSGEAGAEIQMRKKDPKDRSDYAPKEPYWPEPGGKHRAEATRRSATPGVPGSKPKGPEWTSKGKPKNLNAKPDLGTFDDKPTRNLPGGIPTSTLPGQSNNLTARRRQADVPGMAPAPEAPGDYLGAANDRDGGRQEFLEGSDGSLLSFDVSGIPGNGHPTHGSLKRRRTAAPDYLQKADEALTNLLNQKAEEFQQTIAPLQQALQTVQQAEQEAAAANPMNVLPPAGTVNVLPDSPGGAAGGNAGAGGMDPSALAGLMGGGAPPMGGDPSQQPQQMMARRRGKARGGVSPRSSRRQAKNVDELWEQFTHSETLRGGQPDVETFAQKYRIGPKALKRIQQKAMGQ